MNKDFTNAFGVIVEFKGQAPILMETEGEASSHEKAMARMREMLARPNVVRAAMVRLVYEGGNELLVRDLERMQE